MCLAAYVKGPWAEVLGSCLVYDDDAQETRETAASSFSNASNATSPMRNNSETEDVFNSTCLRKRRRDNRVSSEMAIGNGGSLWSSALALYCVCVCAI